MLHVYRFLFPVIWLSWAACWWAVSRSVKATARRESIASCLSHIVPLVLAVILIWQPGVPIPLLDQRLMPLAAWPFWTGTALTLAGLLFTVWARVHLGRNWSGFVTLKEGHELVTSGPYRFVRHPIYTGLLLAFIGSALARGDWRGVVAVLLAFWALWRKLKIEEQWMQEHFRERYEGYTRRAAALIPFIL
jgi:protein-S-isoprenylcysteine O-methyltransferase Ste14